MTESEAYEKWCPMYRVTAFGNESADNRGCDEAREAGFFNCLASDCMMWRWQEYSVVFETGHEDKDRKLGYCGLGGKP